MIKLVFLVFLSWLVSGIFLTLMDRVGEHNLIIWRFQTPIEYILGVLAAISFIWSINSFNFLYPLIVGMCIEWIVKNKLEYPSHVFFLFVLTLYFGHRYNLLTQYYIYIIIYLGISFIVSIWLKSKIDKNSRLYHYFYRSYISKVFINTTLALILKEPLMIIFSLTHTYSSFLTKKYLPGRNP